MSIQAVAWVLEREPTTTGTDRLVLLSLANHANDQHEAWPGIETIEREAGVRRRQTVKDALNRLTTAGLVARKINGCPDARVPADRRTNLYRLAVDGAELPTGEGWLTGARDPLERGHGSRSDGGTLAVGTGAREASPEPLLGQPSGEPPTEPPPATPGGELFHVERERAAMAHRDTSVIAPFEFEDWYRAYPLHKGRGQAEQAYRRARKLASAEVLLTAALAYAAEQTRVLAVGEFRPATAHPTTWLNGKRWLDDLTPQRPARPESAWDADAPTGVVNEEDL